MNRKIGNIILNYDNYSGKDLYSEGNVEEELLDIVKNYNEEDFNTIISQRKKWSIMYHLSNIRTNIIEWIPINKYETVLEVGSGCGAITGVLAEKAKKVTCIELSERRSKINAYRNKEKNNIEILLGNFEDVEKSIREKYDYITLIGVFEYGQLYINDSNPYVKFLETISKHLNKNGKIIIAIENKFGMKYWAGCKEDHLNKYFKGIEDYPDDDNIRTFSKTELNNIINSVGKFNVKFYYPYPDYKLPTTIYSDEYLPKCGELNDNNRNFDTERIVTFDESKVFDSIIKEKLFPLYSNSYLVIIERSE